MTAFFLILVCICTLCIFVGLMKGDYAYAMLAIGLFFMGMAYREAKLQYLELQTECDYQGVGEY